MTIHFVKLLGSQIVAESTVAFRFQRPPGFDYKPGQTVDITLSDLSAGDGNGLRRTFSLVSAPHEADLIVATRMRDSDFKRILKAAAVGSEVQLEGPFGSFTLHGNCARPAVFIAGGIGITPFMSMLGQVTKERQQRHMTMIYANRRPEDASFLAQLEQLEREHSTLRLIATVTSIGKSGTSWHGHIGHIDESLLKKAASELVAPIYYVAGPPSMVAAVRQLLNHIGVDDDDIRSEDFVGY